MENEVWKDIVGYPYQISSEGRVLSIKTHKLLKQRINNYGYCVVWLSKPGVKRYLRVHRIVAHYFLPMAQGRQYMVNHKNDIRTDNRAENLEWCTADENMQHAGRSDRPGFEYRGHGSKLSPKKVIAILEMFERNVPAIEIAKKFNISKSHCNQVHLRKHWGNIPFTPGAKAI